jgi:hypothetical protein
MDDERYIALQSFCNYYNVELSFLYSLNEYGLIKITRVDEAEFIDKEELSEIEKIIHLHNDLDINIEGIDAIYHMLNRVKEMQRELNILKNRLNID